MLRKSLLCLLLVFFFAAHAQEDEGTTIQAQAKDEGTTSHDAPKGEGTTLLSDLSFSVPLTDQTFEHETQASTGQTAGSWLVWIYRANEETKIYGEMPEESFWTDHHIVWATMNVKYAANTRERFGLKELPAVMFIHKGKFYRFSQPPGGYTWEGLVRFCTEDYGPANDIPSPKNQWDTFYDLWKQAKTEGGVLFGGVVLVFAALLIGALVSQSGKGATKKKKA